MHHELFNEMLRLQNLNDLTENEHDRLLLLEDLHNSGQAYFDDIEEQLYKDTWL